jgi:ligand-binding SRPBCC domain-containing protein
MDYRIIIICIITFLQTIYHIAKRQTQQLLSHLCALNIFMHFTISTTVNGHYKKVMNAFDLQLFKALQPKGISMQIETFTGSKKGDKVHIKFLQPFATEWISDIIDDGENDTESFFIDKGIKVPFGISLWQHRHIVKNVSSTSCTIIDDITFEGINKIWSVLLWPVLYISFLQRKAVYKKYFLNY